MFDIGPSLGELLVIGVVALIVVGPEKLPAAVKTISLWLSRFRRSFNKIKMEVEQQINADEIRRQLHNESILDEVKNAKNEVDSYIKSAEKKLAQLGEENGEEDDLFFNTSSNPRAKKIEKQKVQPTKPESMDDLDPGANISAHDSGEDLNHIDSSDNSADTLHGSDQNQVDQKETEKKTTPGKNPVESNASVSKITGTENPGEKLVSTQSSAVEAMDSKSGVDGGNG